MNCAAYDWSAPRNPVEWVKALEAPFYQSGNSVLAASPALLSFAKQDVGFDIWAFCIEQNLSPQIPYIIDRISKYFSTVGDAQFSVITDPDSCERYLKLDVTAAGTVMEIADAYDRYTLDWIETAPSYVRSAIRLSLTVA